MKPMFIFFIVYQLTASYGIVHNEIYSETGNAAILLCKISKEGFTQSWRKGVKVLTQGFEINKKFHGHERLEVNIDERFYILKINNITWEDFDTYWCETQKGNSLTAEGTTLIHLVTSTVDFTADTTKDKKRENLLSTISMLSETSTSEANNHKAWQGESFKSTISATSTSQTNINTGMNVGQSFYYGLFATGFVVLCMSVSCNIFINKCRATVARRQKRGSDGKEHQNVLHGNDTNNDSANEIVQKENEKTFSLYDTINENEMIEMINPTTREHWSNLPCSSNNVQSLQPDSTINIIEDTTNKNLDLKSRTIGADHVRNVGIFSSSPTEERKAPKFIFPTKNEKDGKSNTINKEFVVTIETNNFEDCKTRNNSISVSSNSSEHSTDDSIPEKNKKLYEHPNQYKSLNVNDMEYLNSYSTPITENKLRKNRSQDL